MASELAQKNYFIEKKLSSIKKQQQKNTG